jgi:hypothetical protein
MRGLVVLVLLAASSQAAATPWGDRCKARLAKAAPALGAIGKATITIAPAPAPKTGAYDFKDLDRIGELTLVIRAGDRTYTATVGTDRSRHRHRPRAGLESKRYEEWHSPYVDPLDGDPPDPAEQPMLEEFHHRIAVGVIRGELRVDVAVPATKRTPAKRGPRFGTPTYTGSDKLFADTLRPVLAACWNDVRPDEADPSLAWTTTCLGDLKTAHAALVKLDPVFGNGTCAREPFTASCGNVHGAEPKWNAMLSLAGGKHPTLAWTGDGANRKRYADGGALIWGSAKMTAAQFTRLFAAFEQPLARCWQLLRTNMYP